MPAMDKQSTKPSKEQVIYANLLLIGMVAGIITLIITYTIYLTGLLPPHVDMHLISANWGKGVHEYIEATHSPQGWGWLALLGNGDFLNFIGIALEEKCLLKHCTPMLFGFYIEALEIGNSGIIPGFSAVF